MLFWLFDLLASLDQMNLVFLVLFTFKKNNDVYLVFVLPKLTSKWAPLMTDECERDPFPSPWARASKKWRESERKTALIFCAHYSP